MKKSLSSEKKIMRIFDASNNDDIEDLINTENLSIVEEDKKKNIINDEILVVN